MMGSRTRKAFAIASGFALVGGLMSQPARSLEAARQIFDSTIQKDPEAAVKRADESGASVGFVKRSDGSVRLFPAPQERQTWQAFLTTADAKRGVTIARDGKGDAAACSGCHGASGQPDPGQGFPRIASLDARYFASTLSAFTTGSRSNDMMGPIAKALQPQDIADLAIYYSTLISPGSSPSTQADAALLERGRMLDAGGDASAGVQACNACHGLQGRGGLPYVPQLSGQDAGYLEARLKSFQTMKPVTQGQTIMAAVAKHLPEEAAKAVAAYYASLPPSDVSK